MESMKLEAHAVTAEGILTLAPASARRAWMERTPERFANRCLPLMIANQAGWVATLTEPVEVEWGGSDAIDGVRIFGSERVQANVASHFGSGILTFKLPWLFRLEAGYNLLVRGPANLPKDGIAPLEGIVEADWAIAPFTMNWQVTRPGVRIRFDVGDPVCMLVPARRGELESFTPGLREIDDDPRLGAAYRAWRQGRDGFIRDLRAGEEEAVKAGWQRDYFLGREAPEHQTKLSLRGFEKKPR